ncbi:hypothetical protein GUI51_10835 [Enterococcus mundtii]|nr:hypothetical protein [Enterococcus mundtii]MZZ59419.1 hypothetical protein [Enterococcus mundtii]MZZ62490.1 hypothetical protein [Enterococcus mundtii]MZZ69497.1 hypothetical protein [Enterococcus mundtii]MZZ98283.1 hypothetical protein [Enterococcus mundtii]NAA01270.1 hypothetical protein [Enterococcus mundtii]
MGKKKWLILVSIGVVLVLLMTIEVKKMSEPTEREKQVAFLIEHEEEMAEFVKQQNEKVDKVVFDWNSLEQEIVGNGLPQGAGEVFIIRIQIIDKKDKEINSFGFAIDPDNINRPKKIEKMYTINANYDYYSCSHRREKSL